MSVGGGGTGLCVRCERELPAALFHLEPRNRSGLYSWCKECKSQVARARYDRASKLKAQFGMTMADYDAMVEAQGGVCAICGLPERARATNGKAMRCLSVDHDHATGKVRGLLCSACNKALGLYADDPRRLDAAAAYLRLHA